nr:hypothetical protein [Tanacetum cinerariifolium]
YRIKSGLKASPGRSSDRGCTEKVDWRDDTDDESEDQELEAHYMYMAQLQEVSPDVSNCGPIFDAEPVQKVSTDGHYNVFAIKVNIPSNLNLVMKHIRLNKMNIT